MLRSDLTYMVAAEADATTLSLGEQELRLSAALREQFGCDDEGCARFYLFEAFSDYVIARGPEGKLFRIPYTISDNDVTFSDAQEVAQAYVPVAEACAFVTSEAAGIAEDAFPIVIMRAGWGTGTVNGRATPHYYPPSFIQQVAEAANRAKFGRRHPDQRGADPLGTVDPERIAGWIEGGSFDGQQAFGTVRLLASESALQAKLGAARAAGKLDLFGVSALALIGWKSGVVEGKQCLVAESLYALSSVDLCGDAGAGGRFLAAEAYGFDSAAAQLAAVNHQSPAIAPHGRGGNSGGTARAGHEGAGTMKEALLKLLDALRLKNPARAAELSLKLAAAAESDYMGIHAEALTAMAEAGQKPAIAAEAAQALSEAHRVQSRNRIETKLTASKLPITAQSLVREHLESGLAAEASLADAAIDAEIERVRKAFAPMAAGRMRSGIEIVLGDTEKLALAMEAALGVKEAVGKGIPAFRGMREAYITVTGDTDLRDLATGGFRVMGRAAEAGIAAGDFPNLLLNAQHKRLLQDWNEIGLNGMEMTYIKGQGISDYKSQDRVREGYLGDLPTVTDGDSYVELSHPSDEKVAYTVAKRGGLLTINEATIRNDDLGVIARFPQRLARAGRRTQKQFLTSLFVNNGSYLADNVAWFHASHSNLYALPLSSDSLDAVEVGFMTQTEKDSGKPIGLPLDWLMVPPALKAAAYKINQNQTGANAWFHRFGVSNERIIVNELLTDANDWYAGTMPSFASGVEIGFLDDIEEPQIFLANQPTVGQMFTADQLVYKVKHVFGGTMTDYRPVAKSVQA